MIRKNIYPLTSLRLFAAFMILFFHMRYLNDGSEFSHWLYNTFSIFGVYPVTFFFLLSGFIITYNYSDRFQRLSKEVLTNFYLGRFARIYPLHFLTFLIAVPLSINLFLHTPWKGMFLAFINLFALQGYFSSSDILFCFNGVSWTLSAEFLFYILCPFFLFALNQYLRRAPVHQILLWMFFFWSINLLLVSTFKNSPSAQLILVTLPFTRLIDFILGSFLALIFMSRQTDSVRCRYGTVSIIELVVLLSLPILFFMEPKFQQILYYAPYHSWFMCCMIYVFAFQQGFVSKLLSNRTLTYLGSISFNIYLLHQLVLRYTQLLVDCKTHPYFVMIFVTVCTLILSILSNKFFEIPTKNFILKNVFTRSSMQKQR